LAVWLPPNYYSKTTLGVALVAMEAPPS